MKTKREVPSPHQHAPRLVIGMQPVREAIRVHGKRLGSVLVERGSGDPAARWDALARFATDQGVSDVRRVDRRELDATALGGMHQGAAAWAPALALLSAEEVLAAPDLLVLALDGVQDPQNFGAAIRSAVALGATSIVWAEHATAPLTPATFRASAGAVEHARLGRVPSLVRFIDDAVASGAAVVGLTTDAEQKLEDVDLTGRLVLVIGSEHEGIGRAVRRHCTMLARLTLRGPVESLNASAAAAVALSIAVIYRARSAT
ncbi:MAG TPA: RNA methyltransferase [Polyangiaceae bacterium]|nr:RNA methyltransferase [Polyangiaceae bacterium]